MPLSAIASLAAQAAAHKLKVDEIQGLQAEAARTSLRSFVELAWPIVEPAHQFIPNWHIDAISEHLEAVTNGYIKNLLINISPGCAKSLTVSVLWPTWVWLSRPWWRSIVASYSSELVLRDAVRSRTLIESPWFQETFKPDWKLSEVQNSKSNFETTKKGSRFSTSVGARAAGFRAHALLIDDPLNSKDMYSETALKECVTWWDEVMPSRLNDQRTGTKVIIMQRLSEKDLSEHVLGQGGYHHVCLPMEYEPDRKCITSFGTGLKKKTWEDPRTEPGEIMFPTMFPPDVIADLKHRMGDSSFNGQYQQRPAAAGGGLFRRFWWNFWRPRGISAPPVRVKMPDGKIIEKEAMEIPFRMDTTLQCWDCSFKNSATSDYVAGMVIGAYGPNRFILDCVHERMDLPGTLDSIRSVSARYPEAQLKLVEGKANGSAVIQSLKKEMSGLIEVEPDGNKVSRAQAGAPGVESGNWYLPHPKLFPWVQDLIDEFAAFPAGKHDDFVDAWSYGATRLLLHGNKKAKPLHTAISPFANPPAGGGSDRGWMT